VWIQYMTSKRGSTGIAGTGAYGTHPDAPPPSDAGYKFPPANQVWTMAPDQWDKIHETWVKEWKDVVPKK
jgi:ABC-type Fe3+ transport system substrate-binding protein